MVSSGNVVTTTGQWMHFAAVRSSNITQLYINGAQLGGNYTDNNDYLYSGLYVGQDFNGANNWSGHMDNVVVKKGIAAYATGFTAPTQIDYTQDNIVFGLDGEAPFILSTEETYAQYSGQRSSSATSKAIDYDGLAIISEDVDLGRQEYRDCADIIDLNSSYIAEEAVGRMKAAFSDFTIRGDVPAQGITGGTNTCIRDTKDYILGALIKDLREGGNYHTIYAARTYLTVGGKLDFIGEEVLQSLFTWNQVAVLAKEVITSTSTDLGGTYSTRLRIPNNFSTPASAPVQAEIDTLMTDLLKVIAPNDQRFREGGYQLWRNRDYIAEEVAGYIQDKYQQEINGVVFDFLEMPGFGQPYCERDIKDFIIPAVIADLVTGGTYQTQAAIDKYLDDQGNILHVEHELTALNDAFTYTKMLSMKAINNLLMSPGEVSAGLLDNDGNALGVPGWAQEEYYIPLFTTQSAYRDSTIVKDSEGYPNTAQRANNDRYLDAADMIWNNKSVIAKECVSIMNDLSKYENLQIPGGHVNCEDDVLDMIEAMVHDIRLNCNEKVWDAANLYIEPEDNSLKHIETEWEASITVVKILRDILTMTMRNAFGRDYDYEAVEGAIPVQSYNQNPKDLLFANCGDAIDGNIRYIAEQAVAAGLVAYPNLAIPGGPVNCVHDVTDILRAMVFNLKYGGTNMLQYASEFYTTYSGNLDHVTNAPTETNFIINKAKEYAIRAMKGQVISNNAGWTVDQRFYDAVPRPVTALFNSNEDGVIVSEANNLVTRSFKAGEDKISTTDSGTGMVPDEDAVFLSLIHI